MSRSGGHASGQVGVSSCPVARGTAAGRRRDAPSPAANSGDKCTKRLPRAVVDQFVDLFVGPGFHLGPYVVQRCRFADRLWIIALLQPDRLIDQRFGDQQVIPLRLECLLVSREQILTRAAGGAGGRMTARGLGGGGLAGSSSSGRAGAAGLGFCGVISLCRPLRRSIPRRLIPGRCSRLPPAALQHR